MTLEEVLKWLVDPNGGSFLVISWFAAWGLEEIGWWTELKSKVKSLIILALTILLSALATWLSGKPDIVTAIAPYFNGAIYAVLLWLGTQTAHRGGKLLDTLVSRKR